ncbi:MAG: hypothetical protein Fur0037_18570 [Planctomycetota bacterium]
MITRKPLALLSLLPLGLAALLPGATAQDAATQGPKVALKVNPRKNASTWFRSTVLSSQDMDMGGRQMRVKTEVEWVFSATVLDVPAEDQPLIEFEIGAIKGDMDLPMMGEVAFDSRSDDDGDDVAAAMKSLVGTKVRAEVASNGKLTMKDDLEKVLGKAREEAGGMTGQLLMGVLNPAAVQRTLEGAFGRLPEQEVGVGESWQRTEDAGSPSPVSNKTKLTLAKLDADNAEIAIDGTVEIGQLSDAQVEETAGGSESAAMARDMLKNMKIENAKVSGRMIWCRKDCMVKESHHEISMDLTVPSPMGGEMQVHQVQKMTVARTTAEAAKPRKAAPPDKK